MTDTGAATVNQPNRLYQAAAITAIAVGIFIIAAGLYLLIAYSGCCDSMSGGMNGMNMPSMSPMPSMSQMPNMPLPTPTP